MRKGLTLIEILVALALLSAVLVVLEGLLLQGLRQSSAAGTRTQAVQIMNYVGRRIVGGDDSLLPGAGSSLTLDYGTLPQRLPDLPQETRYANPQLYKVVVRNLGQPSWALSPSLNVDVHEYEIQVCWRQGQETCTTARTFASPPSPGGANPPLEGIN